MSTHRQAVFRLYRELLFMGKEYPMGFSFFRERLRGAFQKNKIIQDPDRISALIKQGDYVVKELEAMYKLRKYRAMKRRYYDEIEDNTQ